MEILKLTYVAPENEDLQRLINHLDQDLMRRYPAEEIFGIDFTDEGINDITFIVAYYNEIPVGCGAIKPIDEESTELKRFFVDEAYRNKGIAKRILSELEARAKALQYQTIKLETGEAQPEAISFYKKYGYRYIEKFGPYAGNESSICFEKKLGE